MVRYENDGLMSINDMIAKLSDMARNNKLGGDAVVHLCIPDMPYAPITDIKVEDSDDGAVVLLFVADEHLKVPMPNVVIDVEGGVVQGVTSDQPMKYLLLDQDNIEEGDTEPEWQSPDYDYKRVSVLLNDPTSEIGS